MPTLLDMRGVVGVRFRAASDRDGDLGAGRAVLQNVRPELNAAWLRESPKSSDI